MKLHAWLALDTLRPAGRLRFAAEGAAAHHDAGLFDRGAEGKGTDLDRGQAEPGADRHRQAGALLRGNFHDEVTIIRLPAVSSIDELVKHVESTQRKELDPKRYRLFKLEVGQQKMQGQACALSRVEAAERMTSDGTGSPVNVMLETLTLICPHPKNALLGINMAYSHRHFPEDHDPQFADDAALLMQTLAFEPL